MPRGLELTREIVLIPLAIMNFKYVTSISKRREEKSYSSRKKRPC